jgi:hypothetical protein
VLDSICNMSFEVKSGLNLERDTKLYFRFDNARCNDVATGSGDFTPM